MLNAPALRISLALVLLQLPCIRATAGDESASIGALAAEVHQPDANATSQNEPHPEQAAPGHVQLASGVESSAGTPEVVAAAATSEADAAQPSAAERISRLETSIEKDQKQLSQFNASLTAPDGEYAKAEAAFRTLDSQRTELQENIEALESSGRTAELEQARQDAQALEQKWRLGKERFDLAIADRKAIQESVVTLKLKLEGDRATLLRLKNAGKPPEGESSVPGTLQAAAAGEDEATAPAPAAPTAAPRELPSTDSAACPPAPPTPLGATGAREAEHGNGEAPPAESDPILSKEITKELKVASAVAERSKAAAKAAEEEERTISDRVEILLKDIGLQRELRDNSAQKSRQFGEDAARTQ